MGFDINYWGKVSGSYNSNTPDFFSFVSTTDTLATIMASAYFNSVSTSLSINDLIYARGSDTASWVNVTAVTPNVTVVAASTNAPGSVVLADLATGIAPSHVVKFAGTVTWSGGGASLASTVTGVAASDLVVTSFLVSPTQAAYMAKVVPTTNTLTFTLSTANTGNDAQVSYVVYRATS